MGSGFGGQFPVIVPELDVVVVLNAWDPWERPEGSAIGDVIGKILPAVER